MASVRWYNLDSGEWVVVRRLRDGAFSEETVVLDYFEGGVGEVPDRQIERDRDDISVAELAEEISTLLT